MIAPVKQSVRASLSDSIVGARTLIVCATYYQDIAQQQIKGAQALFGQYGVLFDQVDVPGALEIPVAIRLAQMAHDLEPTGKIYDAYVALGCIIRGETYHFEVVADQSARGLMDLSVQMGLCIGNGILTVDTHAQALERAHIDVQNKGGDAAYAALSLLSLRRSFCAPSSPGNPGNMTPHE